MNLTPDQIDAIATLRVDPDESDDRVALDVTIRTDPVEWEAPYAEDLPHSSIYVRIVWTPDDGDDDPGHRRVARTWLLDSVGQPLWWSTVRIAGAI